MRHYLFIFSIFTLSLHAYETISTPIVHEGFISEEIDSLVLEPIETSPPKDVAELKSPQPEAHLEWLTGYWEWSKEKKDFIWISGVWRRHPPSHRWISGKWLPTIHGWVRQKGFWSPIAEHSHQLLEKAPPEPQMEKIPKPPHGKESFWISGHWQFDKTSQKYVWAKGRWEEFKRDWIYVPGRYLWKKEGYVYIPPYWDYPLDKRGIAYAPISISLSELPHVQYLPTKIVPTNDLIHSYYISWPNYLSLFHHHYTFQRPIWDEWKINPTWWNWPKWWGFNPYNQWWNWWWWTHKKYPAPPWMVTGAVEAMAAAPQDLLDKMEKQMAPPFVLPQGVVSESALNHALHGQSDKPFLIPLDTHRVQSSAWSIRPNTATNMRPVRKYAEKLEKDPEPYFSP